ncbi:MAG: Lrp/AsnC family transcriptional regulator [Rhodospirillales bacterium]|nr:Lrp/AsnC family transcriptional regulator [Rhodospirillales bacterium]MBO6785737.1 Lrp/AsnC family transcriptional regulator [Rhodospirillales bacterium]
MRFMLDSIDHSIVSVLQEDGRISNVQLAEKVGLSPSACLRRVQILEDRGIITGYAAMIDAAALGRSTHIIVAITLDRQSEDYLSAFEIAVADCPDVMECYLMAGDADYVLRLQARDAADYERIHKEYLSRLPGVARIQSSFALRQVVRRTGVHLDAH